MWHLIGDIGGTNMRLAALSAQGEQLEQERFRTSDSAELFAACRSFIAKQSGAPAAVVFSGAGPVKQGAVQLTNSKARFSEADLAEVCGTPKTKILNDFEAAAWSLVSVSATNVAVLQGTEHIPQGTRLIIGPGTGLGVGALVWAQDRPHVISGEGGHVSLSPQSAEEVAYFEQMVTLWPEVRFGDGLSVEAEAILSGTGVPYFYNAICAARGETPALETAAEIFEAGKDKGDSPAHRCIALFRRYLGSLAGDLGMVFAASGGVFVSGGVAQANPWLFDDSFLAAFNAGGRHSQWRAQLPVYLMKDVNFGLVGAANYIAHH